MPFTNSFASDMEGLFVGTHCYSIDEGIKAIYGSLYAIYKSAVQLLLAMGFILIRGVDGHPLLLAYRFLPLTLMLPVCIYFGFFWKKSWRWGVQIVHEKSKQ